jgi:hypothetical protein
VNNHGQQHENNMNRFLVAFGCAALVASCAGNTDRDVRNFIEGAYVRAFRTAFAVGVDSVVLQRQGGESYRMTKYTRFSRIRNGALLPQEVTQEQLSGLYDAQQQVIHEAKKGKVLSFDGEKGVMLIGSSVYTKVK